VASTEIHAVQTLSGNQARVRRIIEELTQTFLQGTPVMINAVDGGVQAWDGVTITFGIAGFCLSAASNLTVTGTAKTLTFGTVPNESAAVNIPRGAPLNDGRVDFEVSTDDTVFKGQVGPAQTFVASDVGKQYGMTKDADNHWYVDKTKTTVGVNTVAVITKLDPIDQGGYPLAIAPASPRGVYFQILTAAQQQVV
jgi:hypothetical protein